MTQYTELLEDSRRHALDRMIENARLLVRNAVASTSSPRPSHPVHPTGLVGAASLAPHQHQPLPLAIHHDH